MPLVLDNWASFDAPKTGSISRREAFLRGGGRKVGGQHDRVSKHPELRGMRRFGTVRNPFEWYPSLWRFAMGRNQPGPVRTYGAGETTFKAFLEGVTRPTMERIPSTIGCVFAAGKAEKLVRSGKGLCSYTFGWVYDEDIELRRLDDMDADLRSMGLEPVRANTQPSMDYGALYDAEMVGWVQQADGELLERFSWGSPHLCGPDDEHDCAMEV
jgi:hypothetical protein